MSRRKPIVGLCGGVGAGKSMVAKEFERLGCLVIDSDRLNHKVLRRPDVLQTLRGWWGDRVVAADGRPDHRRIAEIVFSNPDEKRRLESLVHPLIARVREDMIKAGNEDPAVEAIILDSPLLLESNLDRLCDSIVFVEASETRRLQRLQRERNWGRDELDRRQRCQKPLACKRSRSDFVINNDGPLGHLRPQVADIFGKVVSRPSSAR
ncbi:MAG TPA: dephospho-CoA kinase [Phycisphaerae bacterium]|nr:dephospho-CoA kinase [Phycisphaerae bacterium]